jgi:hypothetical protein
MKDFQLPITDLNTFIYSISIKRWVLFDKKLKLKIKIKKSIKECKIKDCSGNCKRIACKIG